MTPVVPRLRCGVWPESGPPPDRGGAESPPPGLDGGAAGACGAAGTREAGIESGRLATSLAGGTTAETSGRATASLGAGGAATAGATGPWDFRVSAGAVGLMADDSGGMGRVGEGLAADGAGEDGTAAGDRISSRIRSTIEASKLARALTLTSSPHLWIRSSSSGLLRPNSFANSCTRVDKSNSSWVGHWPGSAELAR